MDSVHLDRRLERVALDERLPRLPAARLAADVRLKRLLRRAERLRLRELVVRRVLDSVAKPRDGNRTVGEVEARDEFRDALGRIRRYAAVFAGVEIARRTREIDRKAELTRELLETQSPRELFNLTARLLKRMQIADFFGLTTFLTEINLLRQTKVEEEES